MHAPGLSRRLVSAAKRAGIPEGKLDALRAEFFQESRSVKIPRAVVKKIAETVAVHGKAVVVLGRSGKFRVFSLNGHRAASASVKKHKPWEKSGGGDAKKA